MPAAAGTANALVTPGTTDTRTPAARHAATSSPPRPSRNGSPPLSRTTRRPACACSTSRRLISCCGTGMPARRLPDVEDQHARDRARPARSAAPAGRPPPHRRRRVPGAPRRVSRSASPGPPPTSTTRPGPGRCRRSGKPPASRDCAIASRTAADRRGSAAPVDPTLTTRSSRRRTAGERAVPAVASSARMQNVRCAVASALDRDVRLPVAGGRDGQPRPVEIARPVVPLDPLEHTRTSVRRRSPRRRRGRRRGTSAPAGQAGRDLPRGDRSAADDDHPPAGQREVQRQHPSLGGRGTARRAVRGAHRAQTPSSLRSDSRRYTNQVTRKHTA